MRSWWARMLLVLVGLVVMFAGLVAWGVEDEYGSDTNFKIEIRPEGRAFVYDVDEQAQSGSPVFEGTAQEAAAYVDRRRAEGESFVVPALIVGAGATLVVVSVTMRRPVHP